MRHVMRNAASAILGGWRCSGGLFIGDDLAQIVDTVLGEGSHAVFADAADPKGAVFRSDRQVEEPVFVLTEEVCNVADREDGANRRHNQAARRWGVSSAAANAAQQLVDVADRVLSDACQERARTLV
jgi:hypothetical protein